MRATQNQRKRIVRQPGGPRKIGCAPWAATAGTGSQSPTASHALRVLRVCAMCTINTDSSSVEVRSRQGGLRHTRSASAVCVTASKSVSLRHWAHPPGLPTTQTHLRPAAPTKIGYRVHRRRADESRACCATEPWPGPGEGLLDALDAVLHVSVQLPQAVDHVIRSLPVATPVGLQESRHLEH